MASYKLLVLDGAPLAQKALTSSGATLDLLSLRIGANNLAITQGSSSSFDFAAKRLANVADPIGVQDADTLGARNAALLTTLNDAKAYTDLVALGLSPKKAVRVASTANITIASALINGAVVDGITLATGNRVLLKDQTNATQNGIYIVVASGAASRSTDMDSLSPIDEINGAWVPAQVGTVNAGRIFVQYGVISAIGTDDINFDFYNPLVALVGGDMISNSGSTFSVDLASNSGLESTNPGNVGGQLQVKLDGSTLAKGAGGLKVATGGISDNEINAAAAIAYSKLALSNSIVNADIATGAAIAYSKLALSNSIVNADIAAGAAIAYSKLALSASIVNADIAAGAAIAYSKLALTSSIVNADINASAAIAYSKLNLAASIVNADIAVGAAIAYSKLALSNSIVAGDLTANSVTKAKLNSDVVNGDIVSGIKLDGGNAIVRQDAVSRTNDNAGTITVRQVVYFKSNGAVDLARANASATAYGKLGLVADATIATTAAGLITLRKGAVIGGFTGLTVGADYYLSAATAGALTTTPPSASGEFIRKVGEAISATELELSPMEAIELL